MNDDPPTLGRWIDLVRRELEWACRADPHELSRFEIGAVELDVTVTVRPAREGGSIPELTVLDAAAASGPPSAPAGTTTQVRVTLTPRGERFPVPAGDTTPGSTGAAPRTPSRPARSTPESGVESESTWGAMEIEAGHGA